MYFKLMGEAALTVKEILPMLGTSSLDIFIKESQVERWNNEYQGALRFAIEA